jgi:hypothetical protein
MLKIIEQKDCGGSILHLLLTDIAHHFRSEDDVTQRLLYLCYDVEDMLLKSGELDSDFALYYLYEARNLTFFIKCANNGPTAEENKN